MNRKRREQARQREQIVLRPGHAGKRSEQLAGWRIAVRTEGRLIRAYWAPQGTMVGAQLVSCFPVDVARRAPDVYDCWIMVLQALAAELLRPLLEPGQSVGSFELQEPRA